jgi:hypothetical protein
VAQRLIVLIAFTTGAVCLCAAGLFPSLWWFMREGAGGESDVGRVHPNFWESRPREMLRQDLVFYRALFAREGHGHGERFRRCAKWLLIAGGMMIVVFFILGAISAARG